MENLPRLNRALLPRLQGHTLGTLHYTPRVGIVHLGLGSFFRAHQALYTEEAMLAAGGDWGVCGVTLRDNTALQEALIPQDGLYSVLQRDAAGQRIVIAQALHEVLAAPSQPQALLERLIDPDTRIVSITVTEKGYCYDPETGGLDFQHPAVLHDLENPDCPTSLPGWLVAGLKHRRDNPFTVLSCDNLAHNGKVLRRVVVDFARALDPALADWIEGVVKFPCTMVDRITPATTDAEREDVAGSLGCRDAWPIPCETFRQWVIEDDFSLGRPAWELAGAMLVEDVTPYELAKLRMLNGTHSTIAYLSMLVGFQTVDEAIAHDGLRQLIHNMMTEEIAPTLTVAEHFDRLAYRDQLLARYANPALKHRTAQIAMDGSLKLPPRLLGTVAERLRAGQAIRRHALAIAAWMRFLLCRNDAGEAFDVSDPIAPRLTALAAESGGDNARLMANFLAVNDVFPLELAAHPVFRAELSAALDVLKQGARHAIEQYK